MSLLPTQEFLGTAEDRFHKLQDQYMLMEKKYDELANYFCFDRKKTTMEEFFGDLTSFCKDFEVGREHLERGRAISLVAFTLGACIDCV